MIEGPDAVLDFWFTAHGPDDWFSADPAFDRKIESRFGATHAALAKGEGSHWRETAPGRLAEILVLDQFSRQLFRGRGEAFATDGMALILSQEAVRAGALETLGDDQRVFLLMPFMHAESLKVQQDGLPLFEKHCSAQTLDFARAHLKTIERFGRFPKRNQALGRASTPEETAYIDQSGESMF